MSRLFPLAISFFLISTSIFAEESRCGWALVNLAQPNLLYDIHPTEAQRSRMETILRIKDRAVEADGSGNLGLIEGFQKESKQPRFFIPLYLYLYQRSADSPYLRLYSLNAVVFLFHLTIFDEIGGWLERAERGEGARPVPDEIKPFDYIQHSLPGIKTVKDFDPLRAETSLAVLGVLKKLRPTSLVPRDLRGLYHLLIFADKPEALSVARGLRELSTNLTDAKSQHYVRGLVLRLFKDIALSEEFVSWITLNQGSPLALALQRTRNLSALIHEVDILQNFLFPDDFQEVFDLAYEAKRLPEARFLAAGFDPRRRYDFTKIECLLLDVRTILGRATEEPFESDIRFLGKFGEQSDRLILERLAASFSSSPLISIAIERALGDLRDRYECEGGTCDPYN
jgi:hypothetical protein